LKQARIRIDVIKRATRAVTLSQKVLEHSSLNYPTPAEFARQMSYGKDVSSAHFKDADGVSNFPTATAAAG